MVSYMAHLTVRTYIQQIYLLRVKDLCRCVAAFRSSAGCPAEPRPPLAAPAAAGSTGRRGRRVAASLHDHT